VDGRFQASLLGSQGIRAAGETKDAAVAALRWNSTPGPTAGELVWLDYPLAVSDLVGLGPDDPVWRESWKQISGEAYRLPDEEKAREFPE
jgi:hypothetical protein